MKYLKDPYQPNSTVPAFSLYGTNTTQYGNVPSIQDAVLQQEQQQQQPNVGQQVVNQGVNAAVNKGVSTATSSLAGSAGSAGIGGIIGNGAAMGAGPLAGIAAGTVASIDSANKLRQGKDPGVEGDASLGLNPLTAWAYWPGKALGLFGAPSTKDIQKDDTKELQGIAGNDPTAQNFVNVGRSQYINGGPPNPDLPFAGKYKTWADYKAAGLQANDLTAGYGIQKTFGQKYMTADPQTQLKITQALIDNNLLDNKKGEVVVTDADKAHEVADSILNAPVQQQKLGNGPVNDSKAQPVSRMVNSPKTRIKQPAQSPLIPGPVVQQAPLLLGPAYTTSEGGPSPYQPQVVTPDSYSKLLSDIYSATNSKSPLKPLDHIYG